MLIHILCAVTIFESLNKNNLAYYDISMGRDGKGCLNCLDTGLSHRNLLNISGKKDDFKVTYTLTVKIKFRIISF